MEVNLYCYSRTPIITKIWGLGLSDMECFVNLSMQGKSISSSILSYQFNIVNSIFIVEIITFLSHNTMHVNRIQYSNLCRKGLLCKQYECECAFYLKKVIYLLLNFFYHFVFQPRYPAIVLEEIYQTVLILVIVLLKLFISLPP